MKFKSIVVIAIVVMLMITMVGCGAGNTSAINADGAVELVIWHDKEDAVEAAMQEKLDQLQPEIVVRMEKKNGLTNALKMVGNDPNAAPDFYFFAHDKIGVYAEMGILTPITDLIEESQLSLFLPKTIEAATYQGTVYQLPIYFETLLFMYNRALMTDEQLPETTEDLFRFVASGAGGRYGFIEQHSTAYYASAWIHGFGGQIISEDGVPQLNTPEVIEAFTYRLKFVERMPGETAYATVNTLFREGRAASTIGGPWLIPTIRNSGIDLGIAKMPLVNATGLPLKPFVGVQGLHVLRVAAENPEKRDAIIQVLELLLTPDLGVTMAVASGSAPALIKSYDIDVIYQDEMVMKMREVAEASVAMPNIPEMDIMWNVLDNLLVDVKMRGRDIQEAVEDAQRRAENLIDAMR